MTPHRAAIGRRVATALILVLVIAVGGVYLYAQASECTQSGTIRLTSAQLSSSSGNGYALFSLCNGTSKVINWVGASVNSQPFFSSGPDWVEAANGTSLRGLTYEEVNFGQVLPSQQVCSFTFTGWVYDAGMTGGPGMALNAASDNSTDTTGIVYVALNDTQVRFQLSNMNFKNFTESGVRNVGNAPGDFKDKWTFMAIVLDNGQTSGFVNGSEVWVGEDAGCMTLQSYAIGGGTFFPFNGVIKNVSIYNVGLTPNEIEQLYSGQSVASGLAGYWSVTDGHGCAVQDSGGNSNGIIEGCISVPPISVYNPNPVSGQNQPLLLPDSISLTSGQRANLTISVEFSDGTTSHISGSVIVT